MDTSKKYLNSNMAKGIGVSLLSVVAIVTSCLAGHYDSTAQRLTESIKNCAIALDKVVKEEQPKENVKEEIKKCVADLKKVI